jgi:hypothetical protein
LCLGVLAALSDILCVHSFVSVVVCHPILPSLQERPSFIYHSVLFCLCLDSLFIISISSLSSLYEPIVAQSLRWLT